MVCRVAQANDGRGVLLSLVQVSFGCKAKNSIQNNRDWRPNAIPFISRGNVDSSNNTEISLDMPPKISERHSTSLSVETTGTASNVSHIQRGEVTQLTQQYLERVHVLVR